MNKLAAALARTPFPSPKVWTVGIFQSAHRDGYGRLRYRSKHRHNLRTTTGIDWQGPVMGGGLVNATYAAGTTAAVTATTATLPTSGVPGGTGVWNGQMILTANRFGVILSNTNANPPVLTIDGWHDATAPGTLASTPATGAYIIAQGQAPIQYLALTADAAAVAAGDTTLTAEIAVNGLSRAFGTYSHTGGVASFSLAKTFNCSGGSTTINKEAVFIGQNGSIMPFESLEPSPPTLISGDTLVQTVTVTY